MADDGFISFANSQGATARGTLMHLTRHQAVFEVYNPYSIVQLSEVLSGLSIRRGERTLYDGRAVVSNLVNTGLMLIVSATLVDPWVDLDAAASEREVASEIGEFIQDWQRANAELRPEFQVSVSNLRNFLEELNRWLGQGESASGIDEQAIDAERSREFLGRIEEGSRTMLEDLYGTFEERARSVPADEVLIHRNFAQRELHPLTMCAPFVHRTFTKPLGYAGDYEMVNMILRDPAEGVTTYARLINMLYLRMGPAEAHRNRIDYLVNALTERAKVAVADRGFFTALNIACGPSHELQKLLSEGDQELLGRCRFRLLDFNQETLDYARDRLEERDHRAQIDFIHKSIHELLKEASGRREVPDERYDVVYCAGLFDYLSDKICSRLLKLFVSMTRPGGMVIATNVHSNNPIRCNMEYLLEWHLIYRDEAGMRRIAPPRLENRVFCESTGINVMLEIDVPDNPP